MGGDGGVIPKNRRYLRGAGSGDKTGNQAADKSSVDPKVLKEERARGMQFCAVSGRPLFDDSNNNNNLVVCPYGRIYRKESVVEALLERKKTPDSRLDHIRGLKDLHPVRFQLKHDVPVCPVRGTELNGQIPAVALIPGRSFVKDKDRAESGAAPNVVSERAFHEMGEAVVLEEYGPAEQRISLLPAGAALESVKEKWAETLAVAAASKKSSIKKKKDKKKRKRAGDEDEGSIDKDEKKPKPKANDRGSNSTTGGANAKSKVFDSLFTKKKDISEAEKADNLFARS